jgi:hypothetical protein
MHAFRPKERTSTPYGAPLFSGANLDQLINGLLWYRRYTMRKSLLLVVAVSLTISCQTIDPEKYARAPAIQRLPIEDLGGLDLADLGVERYFVSLKTRPLVLQAFIPVRPRNPVASVILFADERRRGGPYDYPKANPYTLDNGLFIGRG